VYFFLNYNFGKYVQASKAAIISFFETLRMEVGCTIAITIATPGLIKTDLSRAAKSDFKVYIYFLYILSMNSVLKNLVRNKLNAL